MSFVYNKYTYAYNLIKVINTIDIMSLEKYKSVWIYIYIYTHTHIVFVKWGRSRGWEHEKSQRGQKVLYHFAFFVIVNELLIIKNRRITPTYCLMQARDEMRSSCDRGC